MPLCIVGYYRTTGVVGKDCSSSFDFNKLRLPLPYPTYAHTFDLLDWKVDVMEAGGLGIRTQRPGVEISKTQQCPVWPVKWPHRVAELSDCPDAASGLHIHP